jgi:hypothetical protein
VCIVRVERTHFLGAHNDDDDDDGNERDSQIRQTASIMRALTIMNDFARRPHFAQLMAEGRVRSVCAS